MRAPALLVVVALVAGCKGKTADTAIGASAEGTGGESGQALDAGSAGGTRGTQKTTTSDMQGGASNVIPTTKVNPIPRTDAGRKPSADAGHRASAEASTDSGGDAKVPRDAATTAPLPACPNMTIDVDGGNGIACTGARTFLFCQVIDPTQAMGGPGGMTCLSDDPNRCAPELNGFLAPFTCQDQCEPAEYAVGCNDGFTASSAALPAPCREIHGRGGSVWCCPCGP